MRNLTTILAATLLTGCAFIGNDEEPESPITWTRNSDFFVGKRMEVFIELDDGRRATVNSRDDAIDTNPAQTPIPGHEAQDWTFLKETEHGTSLVYSVTSWDPDNPDDYIMAGWWAEFPGQHLPDLDFRGAERYGIVDGPEIDANFPPDMPLAGKASYLGQTGGIFRYLAPQDDAEVIAEEYQGAINLTADFGEGTIEGCVGCVGDLVSNREFFDAILGEERRFDASPLIKDYEMHLGAAPFEENGSFESYDLELKHPHQTDIGQIYGFWGGSMSNRPDTDGNPRLASGFTVGVFEADDGSLGSFVGSFLALSDTFRESGE